MGEITGSHESISVSAFFFCLERLTSADSLPTEPSEKPLDVLNPQNKSSDLHKDRI